VKVSKTGSGSSVNKAGGARKNYGPSKSSSRKVESADYVDSVELSDAAQQASGSDQVEAIQAAETTTDGPMPDPYETSRKMLEKELKRVFKATYLTDGAKNEKYYDQR
jgi:protein-tyrosine-phosphatase